MPTELKLHFKCKMQVVEMHINVIMVLELSPHWRTLQCVISVTLLSDRHIAFMYCFEAIKWDKSLNYKKATLYNQTGQATRVSSRYYGLVYGVRVFCIIPSDRESGCVRWIHIWSSACVNEKSICAFLIDSFF